LTSDLGQATMSDLQDIIASSSIRAFNCGIKNQQEYVIRLIEKHKTETKCDCPGCESWTNAFEFLIKEIKGEIDD
jgi:hypothetical protein